MFTRILFTISGAMTVFAFVAFCGEGDVSIDCNLITCEDLDYECGKHEDDCLGTLDCGPCPDDGDCINGRCSPCQALTCDDIGAQCGEHLDGCGELLRCGSCSIGYYCRVGECIEGECTPESCTTQGFECGHHDDTCGSLLDCGSCNQGYACHEGACVVIDSCVPKNCAQSGYECGSYPDGCGGTIQCGSCPHDQRCDSGSCVPDCVPMDCAAQGLECGSYNDGCGGQAHCGSCPQGQRCDNGSCVSDCTPLTCATGGYDCGEHSDGCGGIINCGPCTIGSLTPGSTTLQISAAGSNRSVGLWVPSEVTTGPRPLVVALHGNGDTASNFLSTTGLTQAASQRGVILAAPQGINQSFNYHGYAVNNVDWDAYRSTAEGNIDLPLLVEIVSTLVDTGSVNTSRVYIFGHSQGGYLSFRAALNFSTTYAAAVVSAAANPLPGSTIISGAARKIPMAIVIGSNDWAIQNARSSRDELVNAGHEVYLEEIPGVGHGPFPGNAGALLDWLLQRSL